MTTRFSSGLSAADDGQTAGRTAAESALADIPESADFCQVFCSSAYDPEAVLEGVKSVVGEDPSLIGCASTGEFTESETAERAVVVGLLKSETLSITTGLGTGLTENVSGAVREALADLPTESSEYPYQAAIVLHDGLSGLGEQLALVVQRKLGPRVSVAGGAASDNYALESTPVFYGETIADDALVVAFIESERRLAVTVDHGHEPISEPMTATATEGSVVAELDGRPAFEAWADAVREPVKKRFGVDIDDLDGDLSVLTKVMGEFEFGVDQGDSYKVRWPRVEDPEKRELTFAVDIPEGTVFRVMHGHPDDQITSAGGVARSAVEMLDGDPAGAFVYDCACREIILDDRFDDAVAAIDDELGVPFCGFETYGETCLRKGETSGFHNTTTVVLLFPA
ncbi:FIST signal transduction protein [Halorhabdus salina]|uniref:FIST signal transduction protein n=1 Tax=Halorhabdus salina TaxID=2750670 RepID=UPI0015EF2A1C|nr:FIST N-terminal domain-containing protein [Halorhabdus salina]